MEKRQKFQIVYAGLTNLCQHSTTDLTRGITRNEHKQAALSKARSSKHSKTTSSYFVFNLSPTAGKTIHLDCRQSFIPFPSYIAEIGKEMPGMIGIEPGTSGLLGQVTNLLSY